MDLLVDIFIDILNFVIYRAEMDENELEDPKSTPPLNMAEALGLPLMDLMVFDGELEEG